MRKLRYLAGMLTGLMVFGVTGCGQTVNSDSSYGGQPMRQPMGGPMGGPAGQPRQHGMSTKQKVLLVAGAAALYYMYNKHKNAQGQGPTGQYYRSRNGRIYYRDRNGQPVWVSAPQQPMEVPADEYYRYTGQRPGNYDGRVIREAPAGW